MARVKREKQTELLGEVPLFQGLSKKDLLRVARITDQVTVPGGTRIITQDEPGDAFYLLVSGSAVAKRNGRRLSSMGPGDFFGEVALLDGGRRSATVDALDEATLLIIHRRDFESLLTVPSIARSLLAGLASRLRDSDKRMLA